MAGKKLRSGRELVKLFERAGCLAEDTTLSGLNYFAKNVADPINVSGYIN